MFTNSEGGMNIPHRIASQIGRNFECCTRVGDSHRSVSRLISISHGLSRAPQEASFGHGRTIPELHALSNCRIESADERTSCSQRAFLKVRAF
jgi:hypothetical protein